MKNFKNQDEIEYIVCYILDHMDVYADDWANPPRSNTYGISYYQLIKTLINNSTPETAKLLRCGEQTINRTIRKVLMPIFGQLNGGGQTWSHVLLDFAGYYTCSSCSITKKKEEFSFDKYNSNGIDSRCKECKSAYNKAYYKKPNAKDSHLKAYTKNYYKILERNQHYKGERSLRCVKWEDKELLTLFYKNCPEGYHVDHELPLKGELVSGLHVLANLQYITAEENMRKGNRVDLDAYNLKYYGS